MARIYRVYRCRSCLEIVNPTYSYGPEYTHFYFVVPSLREFSFCEKRVLWKSEIYESSS